jgi:hypothetical protein
MNPLCLSALLAITLSVQAGEIGIPQKVRELCAPQAAQISDEKERETCVDSFSRGYKSGLEHLAGTVYWSGSELEKQACAAGREASLKAQREGRPPITPADYGYAKVNAIGYVYFDFEQSEFRPVGSDEVWWLDFNVPEKESSQFHAEVLQLQKTPGSGGGDRRKVIAKFEGYLARKPDDTNKRHFGRYDNQLVVTKIIEQK